MTVTPAALQTQFPEFASVSTGIVQGYITNAVLCQNACVWGSKLDLGTMYLAAHWMVVDGVLAGVGASTLPTGATTSMQVGPVSESFAAANPGARGISDLTDLNLTRYGLVYQRLKRGLVKTPMVA